MFFDTDLLIVVGVISAVTALVWNRSSAVEWVARARLRAQTMQVVDLPFVGTGRPTMGRKPAKRRMVPAAKPVAAAAADPVVVPVAGDIVAKDTFGSVTGRLSVDTQVARIAEIVTRAVDGARDADRLHHAAHRQLDAADYALQNLLHELAAVMSVPGVGNARTVKAMVVAEVLPVVSFETAMAA